MKEKKTRKICEASASSNISYAFVTTIISMTKHKFSVWTIFKYVNAVNVYLIFHSNGVTANEQHSSKRNKISIKIH